MFCEFYEFRFLVSKFYEFYFFNVSKFYEFLFFFKVSKFYEFLRNLPPH